MRKLIAVLCTTIFLVGLLSGCTNNTGILPEETKETVTEIASKTESGTPPSGNGGELQMSEQPIYEYQTQELYAERDGNQIYGVIYIPQNAGEKMPAVIYSHGFGDSYRSGTEYAQALAARGCVVYCFDFCGGSQSSRSDGSFYEMSIFTEQADLEAVMGMLRELDYVDENNLFLLGSSQGGAVSAITAADNSETVKGAILLYPAFVLVDDIKDMFDRVDEIPETFFLRWTTVGRAYAENLLDYDFYEEISRYEKDVLLIHGDADGVVPLSYSERAVEVYPSATLEVIPGAGHGFYGRQADQAIEYIVQYLKTQIES